MKQPDRRSIIVWSSDWTETTGQAIVTRRVIGGQPSIDWIDASYGQPGLRSILGVFRAVARTYFSFFTRQTRTVYLVCSRSTAGFLRDVPALATALMGARVVVHVHGSDIVDLLSSSPLSPVARVLYDRCELIVPSKHLIAPIRSLCCGRIRLCENFLMQDSVNKCVIEVEDIVPIIVWNSNIMASKGFFDLAEAIRLLRDQKPGIRLLALGRVIGDTEMSAKAAQEKLNELCQEEWFTHLGAVSPEEAFHCTARADLVVFPSRYRSECQPLSVIQAMCLGRPLILSDIPALRATLGDYPAIFLPKTSIAALAEGILEMLRQGPSPRLKEAAVEARIRFSHKRFNREMSAIFSDVES